MQQPSNLKHACPVLALSSPSSGIDPLPTGVHLEKQILISWMSLFSIED